MPRKPKPPRAYTSWIVEAPRLGKWPDSQGDFSLWHATEPEARRTFREHVARVVATHPGMAHFVRLIRQDRTIMEEGDSAAPQ